MTVRFLSPAEKELADTFGYYQQQVPGLGLQFLEEVEHATRQILDFPEAWSLIAPNTRRYLVRRFPVALIYRIKEHEILVGSVMHTSRHPDHWRNHF